MASKFKVENLMVLIRLGFVAAVLMLSNQVPAQVGSNVDVRNVNLATDAELASTPHVTAELAAEINAGRPYLSARELDDNLSSALSDDERAEVYRHLFRPINLNVASGEEIMLIPGMSRKLAHEFEEYRPYSSLEQFRREIGKYVDENEVARLEQYVFVPMNLNSASSEDSQYDSRNVGEDGA